MSEANAFHEYVQKTYDAYGPAGDKFFLAKKVDASFRTVGSPIVKELLGLQEHFRVCFAHPATRELFVQKCLELPEEHPIRISMRELRGDGDAAPQWLVVRPPKPQKGAMVEALAIHPTEPVVFAGADKGVSQWSFETGERLRGNKLPAGAGSVRAIGFGEDGTVRARTSEGAVYEQRPGSRGFEARCLPVDGAFPTVGSDAELRTWLQRTGVSEQGTELEVVALENDERRTLVVATMHTGHLCPFGPGRVATSAYLGEGTAAVVVIGLDDLQQEIIRLPVEVKERSDGVPDMGDIEEAEVPGYLVYKVAGRRFFVAHESGEVHAEAPARDTEKNAFPPVRARRGEVAVDPRPVIKTLVDEHGAVIGQLAVEALYKCIWVFDGARDQLVVADASPIKKCPVTLVRRQQVE